MTINDIQFKIPTTNEVQIKSKINGHLKFGTTTENWLPFQLYRSKEINIKPIVIFYIASRFVSTTPFPVSFSFHYFFFSSIL